MSKVFTADCVCGVRTLLVSYTKSTLHHARAHNRSEVEFIQINATTGIVALPLNIVLVLQLSQNPGDTMQSTMNTSTTEYAKGDTYGFIGQRISWSAILAGALIALAVHVVLAALGAGIGLTAYDAADANTITRGTMIAAAVYGVLATIVSMLAGGYVAGKLSGVLDRMQLGLHGLVMWATTTVFVLTGFAMGAGTAFAGMARSYGISYENVTRVSGGALSTEVPAVTQAAIDASAMSTWFAFLTLLVSAAASTFGAMLAANYYMKREVREPSTRPSYKTSSATAGV